MNTKGTLLFALSVCSIYCCIYAERPAHCSQPHPQGYGPCDMIINGFYYNAERNECEQWTEDGCGVKGGHSYNFKEDCVKDCIESNLK
ncbi:PI-actitoxin-Afv2b-like [Anastrepha obliqua]|uniref:PI-actitoxin-Afv2b-like n=1 Tax=Anastrepha obliqua TaxID=95512 RepID=UPI00240A6CF5|nr:PI-actitoxin-Afv2b-like [Anastrepha obliqua]